MKKDSNLESLVMQFHENGILFPLALFTEKEVAKYQLAFDDVKAIFDPLKENYENLHFQYNWANEIVTYPLLLDYVEAVLGPEILVIGSMILSKLPNHYSHLTWHQDAYYSQEDELVPYLTAWIALNDVTVENGCMIVIPGSHLDGLKPHSEVFDDKKNLIKQGESIKINPEKKAIQNIVLSPGEMSLHDGKLIHCSKPNQSNQRRTGFIVRFSTPKIKNVFNEVVHVRGSQEIKGLPMFDGISNQELTSQKT